MADKTVALLTNTAATQSTISTAGTINAGAITVTFDEATPQADVEVMLEKAKVVIGDYYLKK